MIIYSIIHFIAYGISSYSMSAYYGKDSAYAYLFYGICAYALPVILGGVCDIVTSRLKHDSGLIHRRFYCGVTLLGALFSLIGMYWGLYALGVGNALITIGAGLGSMHDDTGKKNNARYIGIFLGAGIPGLWIGNILAEFTNIQVIVQNVWIASMCIAVLVCVMYLLYRERSFQFVSVAQSDDIYSAVQTSGEKGEPAERFKPIYLLGLMLCIASAFLCSAIALRVRFDWKTMLYPSVGTIVAMAAGRVLGGTVTEHVKKRKILILLGIGAAALAGVLWGFKDNIVPGIMCLSAINFLMSMTVYYIADRYPKLRGITLGAAYLGLFIGFLLYI